MPEIQAFDNDYRIFYSQTINIYSNKLLLKKIYWYDFIFDFQKDESAIETGIGIIPDDEKKLVIVNLKNFGSSLWVWTTIPIRILQLTADDSATESAVYFSVFSRSLSETSTFLQVTITFYAK